MISRSLRVTSVTGNSSDVWPCPPITKSLPHAPVPPSLPSLNALFTPAPAPPPLSSPRSNYGEYSGAPNTAETYAYAKTVLDCATAHAGDGRPRALLIGGGIANFTDVAATFTGIIAALKEKAAALQAAKVRIFVRRGGPNYQKGLELMRALGPQLGVPVSVYGPESSMTGICAEACQYVSGAAA